ncbi:MAG: DUF6231 family protein [Guyparkeria sp.]|uniref:DUF6231 family protein n=1 Tax=Guyparkeria sp. TaxID=2035736 RepID=UPI00397DAED3
MNTKKTPACQLQLLASGYRDALSATDNRLISCETPSPNSARLTVIAGLDDGMRPTFQHSHSEVPTETVTIDELVRRASSDDVTIEVLMEVDGWDDALSPLFAALRDRPNRPVIVHFGAGHPVGGEIDRNMVSLGYTRQRGDEPMYLFDIETYKRTPDWLNARNWANPELWGKYRW